MGHQRTVVIHTNLALAHQREWAEALEQGIRACGDHAIVTSDRDLAGDVHIVQGPHYARQRWIGHPRVVWLDRCFWGDATQHVSLAWMRSDGSRIFPQGVAESRPSPELQPWKEREESILVLADYGQDISQVLKAVRLRFDRVYSRYHPADRRPASGINIEGELSTALSLVDAVAGHATTAITAAVIAGVPAICTDPDHPARPVTCHALDAPLLRPEREQWLRDLSYAQWHISETAQAWEYLNSESGPPSA